MPKFTLFTEVLNGEPLLPYWLEHHRRLFDHGVIVLYPSKDNSEKIIKNYYLPYLKITLSRIKKEDQEGMEFTEEETKLIVSG